MGKGKKQQESDSGLLKVRFSIGAKLITIITIIVLVSLGSIIALVSWLVHEDLRLMAEENNFEVNRRSALEAEYTLSTMRSNSLIYMQTHAALGAVSALAGETTEFFFTQNPLVAAMIFSSGGTEDEFLVNRRFFLSRSIDEELVELFPVRHRSTLRRAAAGETVLINAAPWFSTPIIALFFPWQGGGAAVLFAPGNLNDTFGFGTNQSYLINDSGDMLIHAEYDLVLAGRNVGDEDFIRDIT